MFLRWCNVVTFLSNEINDTWGEKVPTLQINYNKKTNQWNIVMCFYYGFLQCLSYKYFVFKKMILIFGRNWKYWHQNWKKCFFLFIVMKTNYGINSSLLTFLFLHSVIELLFFNLIIQFYINWDLNLIICFILFFF